jgi:hypothetical protein
MMVGATGFEPFPENLQPTEESTSYEDPKNGCTAFCTDWNRILYEIIQRWPFLSNECKSTVAALVRGASPTPPQTSVFRETPSKAKLTKAQGGAQRTRAIPCTKVQNGVGGVPREEVPNVR